MPRRCVQLIQTLETRPFGQFSESPVFRCQSQHGHVVEIWGIPAPGTFTVVTVGSDGYACVHDAGNNGETIRPVVAGPPA
jgi:hypothetical protein